MFAVIFTLHCALCVGLIGFVLIQQGKGADAGATFGGGGGNTVLGTGGADFVTKLTTGMAIAFMVTSIFLVRSYADMSLLSPTQEIDPLKGSVMEGIAEPEVVIPEEDLAKQEAAGQVAGAVAGEVVDNSAAGEVAVAGKEAASEDVKEEAAAVDVVDEPAEESQPVAAEDGAAVPAQ